MKNTMKNEMSTEQMNQVCGGVKPPKIAVSAAQNEFYELPFGIDKTLPKYMSAAQNDLYTLPDILSGKTLPKTLPKYMNAAKDELSAVTRIGVV